MTTTLKKVIIVIESEREAMVINTFVIEYATISPAVLAAILENKFTCFYTWRDINEDSFEFTVTLASESKIAELKNIISKYL